MPKENGKRTVLKIICGTPDSPVRIGNVDIECYVLENEARVLSQRGLLRALGLSIGGQGALTLGGFVSRFNEKIPELRLLSARLGSPIEFQPYRGGRTAYGYEATILADICEAILSVRKANLLKTKFHERIADQCEMLMRGFARVGIIALVDKATGYDKIITRRYYEEILRKYITPELQDYPRTFPDEFYTQIFRLRNWNATNIRKRPGYVAWITVDVVYDRLAPNVLDILKNLTKRDEKGRPKTKLYQHLTPDVGHPKLLEHFVALIALMRASPNWRIFYSLVNRSLPRYNHTLPLLLDFPEDEKELELKQIEAPK
jgi:hypothetical protein